MFEENLFDRFCQIIAACVSFVVFVVGGIIFLGVQWLFIKVKYLLLFTQIRMRSFWLGLYYHHLFVWLVLLGLKKPLTWTEIEAFRLKMMAQQGRDIPRPPALEEGLRQERF